MALKCMYKKLLSSIFISNYYHILGVNKLQQQEHPTSHAYKIHLLSPSTHLCPGLDPAAKFAIGDFSKLFTHAQIPRANNVNLGKISVPKTI